MDNCKQCGSEFEIAEDDLAFFKKISPEFGGRKYEVPPPTLCPDCRQQRRLAFRNERYLYKRKCDLCEKSMVSFFDDKVSFPVYCVDCWWSDKWDAMDYGRDFDFSRPFFDQYKELLDVVPKMGLLQLNNENSDYNSLLAFCKNTYMSPGSYFLEDCYYCRKSQYSNDCLDCNFIDHCELICSSINCKNCYSSQNMINCNNCRDCLYVADSTGCSDCFMCASLSKKQYCFKNDQYSKEEYKKIVTGKLTQNSEELLKEFIEFSEKVPKKARNLINCENCSGDYMQNCKNSFDCYDCFDLEDCKYMYEAVNVKDSMDLAMHDKDIELCYELCSGGESNKRLRFSFCTIASIDSDYLYSCFYLKDSFGCDGIHSKSENCVLNKKYSAEEYNELRSKVLEHVLKTGEYGEFLPIELSLYSYNETVANEYFPMSEEEVVKNGWKWREKDPKGYKKGECEVPDLILKAGDDIVGKLLACVDCGKNYRFLREEFDLCKRMGVNLSKRCPDCRHLKLLASKNPRKLWENKCDKCGCDIKTTYDPEKGRNIYCEKCYREAVY